MVEMKCIDLVPPRQSALSLSVEPQQACCAKQYNSEHVGLDVPADQVVKKAKKDGSSKDAAGQLQIPGALHWMAFIAGLVAFLL